VVDPAGTGNDAIAPAVFSWSFGDGKTGTGASPTNIYTSGGTTYTVTLTVSYQGVAGCTNTTTLPVTVTNATLPVITSSPPKICPGETATLSVSPTFNSISWEHGASGASIDVTQPGTYTANATDENGCIIPRSITVVSNDVPEITVTAEANVIPSGQSTQLNAVGAHTFEWSPAESLNAINIPNPVASPMTTTTYKVVGSFIGGCSSEAEITITIDGTLVNITVPVAFSPNGDAANDMWIIDGIESYSDCTLNIFDGRGRRIYQKKGYTNDWDGTYEGKPVPAGTYYYVFACPDAKPVTGSVLVFR
jgi:gliding motility-associated-like protein